MIKLSKIPTTPPKGTEKNEIKKATKKMITQNRLRKLFWENDPFS